MGNNFTADMSVLQGRLTAARAGYLDNLSGGAVALASVMSATRGGYLDNLSGGAVALDAKMDIVDTNVDTLLTRLTSTRAGYLDNLNTPFSTAANGETVIAASASTGTTTITSVDTSRTFLFFSGTISDESGAMAPNDSLAIISYSNSTTIIAKRTAAPAVAMTVAWRIYEWS